MNSIFDHTDYRAFLTSWIKSQGSRSYGLKGRIAEAVGVSSSLISQILKGEKALTPDQTSDLCDYIGLTETEADYLHILVEWDRAASLRFKNKLKNKIAVLREQAQSLGKRVPREKELNDQQKAIYYSSWLYTGIRNLTAVAATNNVNKIAEHLHVEPLVVSRILRFLIDNGLCKESNGQLTYGPASTHVDRDSPFVNKHHQNWRFQAINKMEAKNTGDLFFTSPMSLSVEAAAEITKAIPNFLQMVMKISGPSESETVRCLSFDWFEY